ncbi:MAG: hypothetical protein ACKVH8_21050 [Pirellulales bacterium]|jgi:hypothetical protein
MCRYAWHNYRDHFACFDCRKAFKYWQWEDIDENYFKAKQQLKHVPREIVCPECKEPMIDMGLDFKAPRKKDIEQWDIIKALFQNGFKFNGCGCYVGFTPPNSLREVPEWIENHRTKSGSEKLLEKFKAKSSN